MNRMREAIRRSALAPAQLTVDSGEQDFCFTDAFLGFAGHFPGYPILPAILQTLLAQLLAEQIMGEPLQFLSLKRAKFTRQLRPGDRITVSLSCRIMQGQLHCAAQLRVADEPASSFTLVFSKGASS
jgi:3-hydroxyacyl-[acyl-carrier-protein] dehydratase